MTLHHHQIVELLERKFSKTIPVQRLNENGNTKNEKNFSKMRFKFDDTVAFSNDRTISLVWSADEKPEYKFAFEVWPTQSEQAVQQIVDDFFEQEINQLCQSVPVWQEAKTDHTVALTIRQAAIEIARRTRRGTANRILMNSSTLSILEGLLANQPGAITGEHLVDDTVCKSVVDIPVITCDSLPLDEITLTYVGKTPLNANGNFDGGIFVSFKKEKIIDDIGLVVLVAYSEADKESMDYFSKIKLV